MRALHIDISLLAYPREQMPDSTEAHVALPRPCSFGKVYEFLHVGDPLPPHWHEADDGHLTIIARGGILFESPGRTEELWAPAVMDCPGGEKHSFVALEADTVIVNVSHRRG